MRLFSGVFFLAAAYGVAAAPLGVSPPGLQNGDTVKAGLNRAGSCCGALSMFLPGRVFNSTGTPYQTCKGSYWSQQERALSPACVVIPGNTTDVSTALFILNAGNALFANHCQFAVRSGGHTPFAGASNIQDGITIDLSNLNQVTVSDDRTQVAIGPGNRWGNVYPVLDSMGLATSGGRVSSVGVGGLVTGGGISFFSPRVGMVCDNVLNFEVVLASGLVVNANQTSNTALYQALKGGSNNFGVVTRFDMKAFDQGELWGGTIVNPISVRSQVFQFFENFTKSSTYDPYAAFINSYSWQSGFWIIASNVEYTKPVENPPVWQNYTAMPKIFSTMRIGQLHSFTDELDRSNPAGSRQLFATMTFKNSAAYMEQFWQLADKQVKTIAFVPGLHWTISFQPQPQTIIEKASLTGGNSLGLDASDGDLVNILLTATWQDASFDGAVNKAAQNLFDQAAQAAKKAGVQNDYLYLNYAAPWQKPIAGYGASIKTLLAQTSRLYDPAQLFQKAVPGGFKL